MLALDFAEREPRPKGAARTSEQTQQRSQDHYCFQMLLLLVFLHVL